MAFLLLSPKVKLTAMTIKQLIQQALTHDGCVVTEYSKETEKAVRKLMNVKIRTEQGEFSVLFFDQIDKKHNKIKIILSKVALAHPDLLNSLD